MPETVKARLSGVTVILRVSVSMRLPASVVSIMSGSMPLKPEFPW